MRSSDSRLLSRCFQTAFRFARRLLRQSLSRKLLCFVLLFNLLIFPAPVTVRQLSALASDSNVRITVAAARLAAFLLKPFLGSPATAQRRETTADRTASVTSIHITPARIVGYTGQRLHFSALGSNAAGLTIQGAQFTWASSDAEKLQIDSSGMATLSEPGLVWVSAATPNASARVPVLVRPGMRPVQSDREWQADQEQLHPDGTVGTTSGTVGALLDSLVEYLAPTAHAQTGGADNGDFLYDELWSEPRNLVGAPRNRHHDRIGYRWGAARRQQLRVLGATHRPRRPRRVGRHRAQLQQPHLIAARLGGHLQRRQLVALSRLHLELRTHRHLRPEFGNQIRAD